MAPKERKSITPWMLCQKCNCTVSNKDVAVHSETNCPPNLASLTHGYIHQDMIANRLEELKSDAKSLQNIPARDHPYVVQLSQQAMQLCHVGIGDYALVTCDKVQAVRIAWPTQDGSLTSIFLTRTGMELLGCKSRDIVSVSKLKEPPVPAKSVGVQCLSKNCDLDPDRLLSYLQSQQVSKVIKLNDKIALRYLGNTFKFKATKIKVDESQDDVDRLADTLQELNIDASNVFYGINSDTMFYFDVQDQDSKQTGPKYSLDSIGGLDDIITEIQEMMQMALLKDYLIPGIRPPKGVLLCGAPGVGKSLLAQALGESSGYPFYVIRGPELFSKFYGETEGRLRDIFKKAIKRAPSVIFIDEVDVLCNRRSNSGQQVEQRIVASLLSELDALQHYAVMVLAATSRVDAIDDALRRPGRLDREIELPVPGPEARKKILKCILASVPHSLTENEIDAIANYTHGYVGADLQALCSHAAYRASRLSKGSDVVQLSNEHFNLARHLVKPSAMREVALEIPPVRWADIGGQHELKLKLRQAVEWPLTHPEAFIRLGIRPPRGVLMYGPPGCSKTMIARALATESGLNFLSIKGPELFSKWVGESEKAVRAVFRRARQVAPAIVFFDELDALCGERGGASTGSNVQERVLAQLLTELDGVEPLGNVTVVAATNRPDRIDKALLRPGRLDRIIHVPLPDDATRQEIFNLQFRKTPIAEDINIPQLVSSTSGYSGAEVTAVCHEAALAALEEDIQAPLVKWQHFLKALKSVTPRTPQTLLDLYKNYHL